MVRRKTVRLALLVIAGLALFALVAACEEEEPEGSPVTPAATFAVTPTASGTPVETAAISRSLAEAMNEGLVEVRITGNGASSGDSIVVGLTRTVAETIRIDLPRCTALTSANPGFQSMVTRRVKGRAENQTSQSYAAVDGIILTDDQERWFVVEAYCSDFHLDNPQYETGFAVAGQASQEECSVLAAADGMTLGPSISGIQAAIWAVTDDPSLDELRARFPVDLADLDDARVILEVAGVHPDSRRMFSSYTPEPATANLFRNGGFERGRAPWFSLHPGEVPPFEVSQDFAQSGESSALLRMRVPAEEAGNAKVFYLVQEVTPEEFPELISGYYRVENWTKGTPKQYLQFVVIAFDVANLGATYPNYQMRYPLAGISEEPFGIANAFFVFLSKEEPRTGEWVYFERNIKEDFQQFWGVVPEGFSKLRILFEVRYDDKQAGTTPAEADVYYDSLYMGPASENPNKP